MTAQTHAQARTETTPAPARTLQRGCACGESAGVSGRCPACEAEERLGVRAKLRVNRPDDRWEREADRVAEQILSERPMPAHGPLSVTPLLQRQTAEEEEEDEELQAKPAPGNSVAQERSAAGTAAEAVGHGGRPLAPALRRFFEPRFGRDLSSTRIHDDARAGAAARSINARAYTLGRHIAFAPGEFAPQTREGRRLIAHELTHSLQQGATLPTIRSIQRDNDDDNGGEAEEGPEIAITFTLGASDFDSTIAIPVGAGGTATLQAHADVEDVTWSIEDGSASVAAGTSINEDGEITLAAGQPAGSLMVRATVGTGYVQRSISVAAAPTGIDSTSVLSDLNTAEHDYGAAFQHVFTSAQGSSDVLENLNVGERFPAAPSPEAAVHRFSGDDWPFGGDGDYFDLETGTLADDAAGAWSLDANGEFSPPSDPSFARGDNVSTPKAGIDVGDHVQSHSNPTPRNRLPVSFTLEQQFHFYNPRAASGNRWTQFTTTAHSRTLRRDGDDVEFVTTVNGVEHAQDYEGDPAVFNLTASPVNTPKSAPDASDDPDTPGPRTVELRAETLPGRLPADASLVWRIVGNALGCTVEEDDTDSTRATLTIGNNAGTVTIELAAASTSNSDRVEVVIT